MVYVPSGQVHIGQGDQDVFSTFTQRPKSISLQGFFMDDTEITNNEYRQFVYWVRDSIAHTIMGDVVQDDNGNESIDWEIELDYSDPTLDEMYYQGDMAFSGKGNGPQKTQIQIRVVRLAGCSNTWHRA